MKIFPYFSPLFRAGRRTRTCHNAKAYVHSAMVTVNPYHHQARITCAEIAYSQVFHFRKKLKTVGSYQSLRPNLFSTRDASFVLVVITRARRILHHQFLKEIENFCIVKRIELQAGLEPASPPSPAVCLPNYTIEV